MRNKFLIYYLMPLFLLSLVVSACSSIETTNQIEILNFNPEWKLAQGSFSPLNTDDSKWDIVSTPHTYHEKFVYQGINNKGKDLGAHTYRKHFTLPSSYKGKKLLIEFEGIRQRGQFYLNGHLLGRISDGVTPFGFDLTPYVHWDEGNVLHVEIDCIDREFVTNEPMCWFFPGFNSLSGGICRNVFLHIKPKVYATLPLFSGLQTEGTYIFAENISTEKKSADIGVETQVRNDDDKTRTVTCEVKIIDPRGKTTAHFESKTTQIAAGETFTFKHLQFVKKLHFWQPEYPFLYDVITLVKSDDGSTDVSKTVTGFRKIEVRGAELYLNNRLLMTHGYTPRSQNEWPAVGSAYPDWLHDYSNAKQVEGNGRIVRWMHTMPSPQDVRSCDRVGLMQIMPGADRENDSQGREWDMRVEIMRNTIIYCRNNPSVIFWEAANNVISKEHIAEMIALRDQLDPRGYRRPMGGRSEGHEWVSWMYGVRKEQYRLSIDTEYMRDESPRRWWDSYSPPYYNKEGDFKLVDNAGGWNRNQDNMCLMQSIVYEQYFKSRPGTGDGVCSGGTQILFADSESFSRSVDLFRRSGPVDGMRVPKDAFFANQTMWNNTPELWTEGRPSIFIPGHWNYPNGTEKPINVFISPGIENVELRINGKKQPKGERFNTFVFTFKDVIFEPGRIDAIGYDSKGKQVASYTHETVGEPVALTMNVISHPEGMRADGSDMVLIETETVDALGRRAPLDQSVINYNVDGPAVWRGGIWEEDVPRYANKKELPVINGVHRVIVRSTLMPGVIRITASAKGMQQATVEIPVLDVGAQKGYYEMLPAILPVKLSDEVKYGKDLPPAPTVPKTFFEKESIALSATGEAVIDMSTAFPQGAILCNNAQNGSKIYSDRPWVFEGLPAYLKGAYYLQVANDDAVTSAGEGVVFKIGGAGRVYVAYDVGNIRFPIVSSPTQFTPTNDKIRINGHLHTIYKSGPMNGGELTYLGTNSWIEKAPDGLNNYIVFISTETDDVSKAW
jgi:hypothetical protein